MLFLLGLIDLICALSLLAAVVGYPVPSVQAGGALLLIGKGFVFYGELLSIIDIIVGIVMFVLLWSSIPVLAIALAAYLTGKAVYSFF